MKRAEKITKFLEGVGSLISVYPTTNNRKINLPEGMNHSGFKNDWDKIGQDMWRACQTIESNTKKPKQSRNDNDRFKQTNA